MADGTSRYLELMEIAPLSVVGGSYETASQEYNTGEFVDAVLDALFKKSVKYGTQSGILLLLYVTDFKLLPGLSATRCLEYRLAQNAHCFERVFMFVPISRVDGPLKQLYPSSDRFADFDYEGARATNVHSFDPQLRS